MPELEDSVRLLVERNTPISPPPFRGVRMRASRHRRRHGYATAAAATATVASVGALAIQNQTEVSDPPGPSQVEALKAPNEAPQLTGALPAGGLASCAHEYNGQGLRRADFAFDGVITQITPLGDQEGTNPSDTEVTFHINTWFRGGDGEQVTTIMGPPTGAELPPGTDYTNSEYQPTYSSGTRLLVSGAFADPTNRRWEDALIWPCGFTRYHDAEAAELWEQTFK